MTSRSTTSTRPRAGPEIVAATRKLALDKLLRAALAEVPARLLDDMLQRIRCMIGVRLNDFYRVAFDSTYKKELEDIGYGAISSHLIKVQEQRNKFAHGQPQAIDNALVYS
jgi:hypothetical protein